MAVGKSKRVREEEALAALRAFAADPQNTTKRQAVIAAAQQLAAVEYLTRDLGVGQAELVFYDGDEERLMFTGLAADVEAARAALAATLQ